MEVPPSRPSSRPRARSFRALGDRAVREAARQQALRVSAMRRLASEHLIYFLEVFTPEFKRGWHIEKMCEHAHLLEAATRNPEDRSLLRRLTVTMPPRHAKSQTYAKGLPLWFLARNPDKEVIVTTSGSDLAEDHGLWCKQTAKDPRFKAIFPKLELRADVNARDRLLTHRGGGIRFVGRDGQIVGRGAHLLIIDDPYKDAKEADSATVNEWVWNWYWTGPRTRMAPGGVMVVMHTRWRVNDLIGRLKMADANAPPEKRRWKEIDFPAIAEEDEEFRKKGEALHPARYDISDYEELLEHMPPREWLALYQQRPVAESGNFFKREHFDLYDPAKLPPADHLYFYLPTDYALATKEENDYTCLWPMAVTADDHQYFLPDFVHAKLDVFESVIATLDLAERYGVMQILIEPGPIYHAVVPMLEREMRRRGKYFAIVTPPASGADKRRKAASAQAASGMGLIHLPDTPRVHHEMMPEILAFDKDTHDDVVDTLAIPSRCLQHRVLPTPTGINFSDSLENPDAAVEWAEDDDQELVEVDSGIPSLFSDW